MLLCLFFVIFYVLYSDDGEREDSDNDTSPKKGGREYRDTLDNISQVGKSAQTSVSSTNASPARTMRTIKKVDLGAAANYGKEQSNVSLKNKFDFVIKFFVFNIQYIITYRYNKINQNVFCVFVEQYTGTKK